MIENQNSKAFYCRKAAQFLIAIIFTLIIGKVLAKIPLFSSTEIVSSMTSADLVGFIATMAVLVFVFMFTRHAINALEGTGNGVSFLRGIAIPVASLVIVAVAQASIRGLLNPFVGATGNSLLTLLSSLTVFLAALWVVAAIFQHSLLLYDFIVSGLNLIRSRALSYPAGRVCSHCARPLDSLVKYCPACGTGVEMRQCKNCNAELNASAKFCGQCGHLNDA
jgi:hypothetical protein